MRAARSSILALALLGIAALAGSSTVSTEPGPVAAPAAPAVASPALEPAGSCAAGAEVVTAPGEELFDIACGRCANRCFSDAQCTAQCGGFPGSCVQVNSCCQQCLCAGFAVEQAV